MSRRSSRREGGLVTAAATACRKRRPLACATAALGAAAAGYVLEGRRWQLHWGAGAGESAESLPGDRLIPTPDLSATRAITIAAMPGQVWPWIAQLGQGRGGFYSYDFLENLLGCDIHSADRIVREWQSTAVGDEVRLTPTLGLGVAIMRPGEALVLRGGIPMGEGAPPFDFTWSFTLRKRPDAMTRLLVRERYAYTAWWAPVVVEPVEVVSFVMHQKMLRGIRDRAEREPPGPGEAGTSRCGVGSV
jgi:hypothetical protein